MPTSAGTSWPRWWNVLETSRISIMIRPPSRFSDSSAAGSGISSRRSTWWQRLTWPCAARRRPAAARPCGTSRRPARSGRRTRTSAAACRSGAALPGIVYSACSVLRTPWRGRHCSSPIGVRVLGRLEDLDGVALLDDLAGVHHADAVAHRADHAEVVGDQQDGGVGLVAQRPDEVEHLGLDGGVEARRRLVEHEQLRVAGQRHGDDDTLLHAARQLVRVAVHHPLRDRRCGPGAARRAPAAEPCALVRSRGS